MSLEKSILHCLLDTEPAAFYGTEPSVPTFAVNLGFECQTNVSRPDLIAEGEAVAAKQAELEQDEAEAEIRFKTFANTTATVRFHLFKALIDPLDPTLCVLTEDLGEIAGKISDERVADAGPQIISWLQDAAPKVAKAHYWTVPVLKPGTASQEGVTVDAGRVPASYRLRAAHAWNAPVAHRLSLTHILRPDLAAADPLGAGLFVILPFFNDPTGFKIDGRGQGRQWDFAYDPGGDLGEILCRTEMIDRSAAPLQNGAIGFLTPEGYLTVDPDAGNLWRVSKWFDARAASLMAPVQALSGPASGTDADKAYDALFHWRYEYAGAPRLNAPGPAWLAVTSLCASLDNIVLGIKMPVSGANSAGDILGSLAVDLSDAFEGHIADRFDLKESSYDLATLVTLLRSVFEMSRPSDLGDPDVRRRLAGQLRQIHDINSSGAGPVEQQLLDALLTAFVEDGGIPVETAFLDTIRGHAQDLLKRALMEAEQKLQEEAGAEAAILSILETPQRLSGRPLSALFADAYLVAAGRVGDSDLLAAVETAFASVWRQYRDRLLGPFNGAEAIRRASASEFSKALLSLAEAEAAIAAAPAQETSSQRLIRLVKDADYHTRRLLGPVGAAPLDDAFAVLADALVRPLWPVAAPAGTQPVTTDDLRPFFTAAYGAALSPIEVVLDPAARFMPDNAPAPLPLQIAANRDGVTIDFFTASFNGIAVAIRRLDTGGDADRWAHASLADLAWPRKSPRPAGDKDMPETVVQAAIHPMLPSVSDGRGPMFIEYEGLPLAAETFSRTAAEAIAAPDPSLVPFYDHKAPDLSASDFAKIPRLAYGRRFETFSFATTNAGTLPHLLQGDRPWMPKATFDAPAKVDATVPDLVSTTDYQRRTAIGQVAVNERPKANTSPRIGAPVDGVVPLAQDYPRTVIAAYADNPGFRDLFRDRSGGGTLLIPADLARPLEWRIAEPVFTGQPDSLSVRLFSRTASGPDDPGLVDVNVPVAAFAGVHADIRIGIRLLETGAGKAERILYLKCGEAPEEETAIPGTGDVEGWLRLSLTASSSATLSFAAADDLKPYEPAAPLLLLAPDNTVWSGKLNEAVTLDVDTPRVGYLDFQQWFANSNLLAEAFEIAANPANRTAAERLETALLTAYVLRDTDEDLARHLDRLPDPAVCGIRVELAVEDQLVDLAAPACDFRDVSLKGKLLDIARGLNLPAGARWTPGLLKQQLFLPLDGTFRFSLAIKPGPFALEQNGPVVACVSEGLVARLTLHALVPAANFESRQETGGFSHPPVLHAGLKQHAAQAVAPSVTIAEACFSYASPVIRIEAMLDGMKALADPDEKTRSLNQAIRLAAEMIAVRPVAQARRYDIETRGALPPGEDKNDDIARARQWRLLSEIDITSQRWRPSGRPIYNHIDPAAFFDPSPLAERLAGQAPIAALPLRYGGPGEDLARFEQEAFFDRPNIDSRTVTQRLLPLPSRTILEQHVWDAPSATYFRHRFTLRSRYAGALKSPDRRAVPAWIADRKPQAPSVDAWTLRVAMLADLARVQLTRPQQRALIPLTVAPNADAGNTRTPPVLSILQEPPFARGGLADRIAAEIKTGFAYGFEAPRPGHPSPSLEVLDARKEIGPDPRLSYRPLDEDVALGIALNVEGSMGLTFDAPNVPAPAFPNSMLSLSPVQTSGTQVATEEHFLGVSMRRYIDPNWTMRSVAPDIHALDGERCWWIDHDTLQQGPLLGYRIDGRDEDLLTLVVEDDIMAVRVGKAAIDGGVVGAETKSLVLCHWSGNFASGIAILHQPVVPGRYSTSIFVSPRTAQADVPAGRSNAPLLLCNFEWSPPKSVGPVHSNSPEETPKTLTLRSSGRQARPAMASAPTFLAWTRTGRDFDSIHLPLFEDGAESSLRVRAAELLANFDETSASLTFGRNGFAGAAWPCASTFRSQYPLHVQRHLAVLATRFLAEPGRPVEQYGRSALLVGKRSGPLYGAAGSLDRARIVEFETPAAILCGSGGVVPQTYRKAYFDLVSTGFKLTGEEASARLFVRFAGPAAHLRRFTALSIDIAYAAGAASPHEIPVILDNPGEGPFAVAVELFVARRAAQAKLTYSARVLYSDGAFKNASPVTAPDVLGLHAVDNANPGLFVSLAATGADDAGEFWADVSLLHAPRADFDRGFDFGWLFSSAGHDGPVTKVSPEGLAGMIEAQGRIVSVSPPVPISVMQADIK